MPSSQMVYYGQDVFVSRCQCFTFRDKIDSYLLNVYLAFPSFAKGIVEPWHFSSAKAHSLQYTF